jgi:hypothetical protein
MVMVMQVFEVISDKHNIFGASASGNCAQKYIMKIDK